MSDSARDDYREKVIALAADLSVKHGVSIEYLALTTLHIAGALACKAFDTRDVAIAMELLGNVEAASLGQIQ